MNESPSDLNEADVEAASETRLTEDCFKRIFEFSNDAGFLIDPWADRVLDANAAIRPAFWIHAVGVALTARLHRLFGAAASAQGAVRPAR